MRLILEVIIYEMPKNLFFVDSIYLSSGEAGVGNYVNLICTDKTEDGYFPTFYVQTTDEQMRLRESEKVNEEGTERNIEEGDYVIYEPDRKDGYLFTDGSQEQYAVEWTRLGNAIREALAVEPQLSRGDLTPREVKTLIDAEEVLSYHINVGHGNCSLILVKSADDYILWMVDCSIIERGNSASSWHNHQSELKACLDSIGRKLNTNTPHIARFFLTHMHYDHYSGVNYLWNCHYIDDSTIYYINHYYECNSETMVTFLQSLKGKATIIEPISSNSLNSGVGVLYPDKRIFKKYIKRANNASAVYCFNVNGRSMVFPGDLEAEGFKDMAKSSKCSPWLHYSDFYAISHHGSLNGHPSHNCQGTHVHPTILKCLLFGLSKVVLMGRDGAYPTMFDPDVVSCFDYNEKLVTTDMKSGRTPLKYLSLNWLNDGVKFVY